MKHRYKITIFTSFPETYDGVSIISGTGAAICTAVAVTRWNGK
jgi:hypothetical protein